MIGENEVWKLYGTKELGYFTKIVYILLIYYLTSKYLEIVDQDAFKSSSKPNDFSSKVDLNKMTFMPIIKVQKWRSFTKDEFDIF